jgi:hypothetical protein
MSYPPQPDDQYWQQNPRPSFTPYAEAQGRAAYPPPQALPCWQPQGPPADYGQTLSAVQDQHGYPQPQQVNPSRAQPGGHRAHRQAAGKQYGLCGAEAFWYVLGCIGMGVAYFSKLPAKKAMCEVLSELQLDGQGPSRSYSLRGAEGFWYLLMCLGFGAGYFAKVSAKKALWEVVGVVQSAPGEYAAAIGRALSGSAMPSRPGY